MTADKKTHITQVSMTEPNWQRYDLLVRYYYATTPGARLGTLAVEDLINLEGRVLTDIHKGLSPPVKE